jgi:hypothetical protein
VNVRGRARFVIFSGLLAASLPNEFAGRPECVFTDTVDTVHMLTALLSCMTSANVRKIFTIE